MKRIFTIAAALIMTASVWAQSPGKMSYQAIIRDAGNTLVTTQTVGMQISILQGGATGTAVYVETQTPSTNINGLVSIEIGTGTVVSGTFNTIDWSNGPYFVKTETDPTGGTAYTIAGTSQLISVPYALHAKFAESVAQYTTTGYIHTDTILNFITNVVNGEHLFYEIASTNEVYNNQTEQFAIVGASKDNHNPIDPDNDTRAFMIHNDGVRKLTKLVILEPGELTIGVINDSVALGVDPTLAVFQMRDNTKEIIIGNGYADPLQKNLMLLTEDATMLFFTTDDGVTYRAFRFADDGIKLVRNDTIVHSVGMDGVVTINDVLNITPRATAPPSPMNGTIYFDAITNKLMVYDGTIWQACW